VAGGAIRAAAIDTAGFRFCELRSWRDPAFLPGAVKYGDLPAMLALSAPQPLWIGGEPKPLTVVEAAYTAAGVIKNLHQQKQPSGDAVAWLLSWE
jgi:hypothetical protein